MSVRLHLHLARLDRMRLAPTTPKPDWRSELEEELALRAMELDWIEEERARVAPIASRAPRDGARFVRWFEQLREDGPGQHDPLFPWLAEQATLHQLRWFLRQEVAGEAGFADLVALTQLRLPDQPKLELARNYWDEMGRGHAGGMHGPMLARLARDLELAQLPDDIVWESRALGNMLCAFAANRRYTYQAIGALGVVELTAPGHAALVNAGLERAGVKPSTRQYYALHATLDIKHSEAWNREVLLPLVAGNPDLAPLIAEGALLRLEAGARCFARYREELSLVDAFAA
ncbi:MAG TPA: iron-containing redox enzyme family protein [Kofleriaceae bacterium]|nr:iron-containing redox enzyme family protein [Kofleriaceae bacterium]